TEELDIRFSLLSNYISDTLINISKRLDDVEKRVYGLEKSFSFEPFEKLSSMEERITNISQNVERLENALGNESKETKVMLEILNEHVGNLYKRMEIVEKKTEEIDRNVDTIQVFSSRLKELDAKVNSIYEQLITEISSNKSVISTMLSEQSQFLSKVSDALNEIVTLKEEQENLHTYIDTLSSLVTERFEKVQENLQELEKSQDDKLKELKTEFESLLGSYSERFALTENNVNNLKEVIEYVNNSLITLSENYNQGHSNLSDRINLMNENIEELNKKSNELEENIKVLNNYVATKTREDSETTGVLEELQRKVIKLEKEKQSMNERTNFMILITILSLFLAIYAAFIK
ncbi:MAG: hypothetical protein ACK4MM_06410, partial [Fervidobacterium sp.]